MEFKHILGLAVMLLAGLMFSFIAGAGVGSLLIAALLVLGATIVIRIISPDDYKRANWILWPIFSLLLIGSLYTKFFVAQGAKESYFSSRYKMLDRALEDRSLSAEEFLAEILDDPESALINSQGYTIPFIIEKAQAAVLAYNARQMNNLSNLIAAEYKKSIPDRRKIMDWKNQLEEYKNESLKLIKMSKKEQRELKLQTRGRFAVLPFWVKTGLSLLVILLMMSLIVVIIKEGPQGIWQFALDKATAILQFAVWLAALALMVAGGLVILPQDWTARLFQDYSRQILGGLIIIAGLLTLALFNALKSSRAVSYVASPNGAQTVAAKTASGFLKGLGAMAVIAIIAGMIFLAKPSLIETIKAVQLTDQVLLLIGAIAAVMLAHLTKVKGVKVIAWLALLAVLFWFGYRAADAGGLLQNYWPEKEVVAQFPIGPAVKTFTFQLPDAGEYEVEINSNGRPALVELAQIVNGQKWYWLCKSGKRTFEPLVPGKVKATWLEGHRFGARVKILKIKK